MAKVDDDGPAYSPVITRSGREIDSNNFPGKLRAKLVMTGEMAPDSIGIPPNMPGKKLAEFRAAARDKAREAITNVPLSIGDHFLWKGHVYSVIEDDGQYIYFNKPSPKGKKVTRSKVKKSAVARHLVDSKPEE